MLSARPSKSPARHGPPDSLVANRADRDKVEGPDFVRPDDDVRPGPVWYVLEEVWLVHTNGLSCIDWHSVTVKMADVVVIPFKCEHLELDATTTIVAYCTTYCSTPYLKSSAIFAPGTICT